jgi:hypothetical protein
MDGAVLFDLCAQIIPASHPRANQIRFCPELGHDVCGNPTIDHDAANRFDGFGDRPVNLTDDRINDRGVFSLFCCRFLLM